MRFQCPFCRGIVAVENSDMGSDVQCGHCGEVVTVPCSRLATGAVIADFIILEELGRGGMGIVYLAHQISLDRPAAVKILADNFANNAEFVVNFIKEARAAAKLNHPHIVQAYAVGEDEGVFFFAMEHIDGETMKQVLRRDKVINVEKCITIIQQISEALDYAWKEAKLIHRDIKPDNIMLTKNGRAKLADLGLSKVAGDPDDADSDEVMGTPQYISPEHLTGAPMDGRSDIYSLGATFYHLITGRFPFEGRTATEIARKHLEEPLIAPHLVNPEIPIAVGQIIEKMMAKNIKSRYQDAEQLVDDLRMVRRGKRPPTATQGVKAMPGQTKLGMSVTATRRQLQTQLKTINMHLTGMMGKTQTGTIADLDSLASLELKRQQRRRIVFICGIAVIVAVGAFLAIHFMFSSGNGVVAGSGSTPDPIEMIKPKQRQAANPYITRINRLLEEYKENPDRKNDFLGKADSFLETFPSPRSKSELESLNELLNVYVPLDESLRVSPQRTKLEDKYLEELDKAAAEKARKIEEQRRREEEKKRKQEEERQRKLEEERKRNSAEAQRKRQADRFIAELNTRKVSLRQKLADMAATEKYDELDKFLSGELVQAQALPERAVEAETKAVKDFTLWSESVAKSLKTGVAMYKLIYNGGEKLTGFSVEIKGELVRLESIENGIVNTKPLTGGSAGSMPINQLPANIFRILINKAQKETGDDNAVFYYRLVTGAFAARMQESAPEGIWKDEYPKYVHDYLKSKLDNASAQEKRALELRYRELPEFKKLAR